MYRNSFRMSGNTNTKTRYRVVLILCLIFFVSTVVLAFNVGGNSLFRKDTARQLELRTQDAISSAIAEVESMGGLVSSNSPAQLARVRQYIYVAQQLSEMSVSLNGESGRLIPLDFFDAAYRTLDTYQSELQMSTSNTNNTRMTLLTQLINLQNYLNEN